MNTIEYLKIVSIIYLSYYLILIVWDLFGAQKKSTTDIQQLILSKDQPTKVQLENEILDDSVEQEIQNDQGQSINQSEK
ncbi:MAG: hypothetical protein OXC92_06425 [Flavobacteriaceae bacterium]|nr:hypothetical protein [Flavobacteriaceae bacterium]MCY4216600.1 hypothetical protein [Flavobacteriaceae bacterium]MCY4253507.1 hypothetical protein [Flavobacteriaceae bacterium]